MLLQVMESWAVPGNKARTEVCKQRSDQTDVSTFKHTHNLKLSLIHKVCAGGIIKDSGKAMFHCSLLLYAKFFSGSI